MSDPAQNRRAQVAGLVVGFLAGDPYAREALPRETWADLLGIARRVAPDLEARGLADDVVSEVFRLLLSRPAGHYDPDRGDPWGYLREMVRLAARDVHDREAPAGTPRRPRRDAEGGVDPAPLPVPLEAGRQVTRPRTSRTACSGRSWRRRSSTRSRPRRRRGSRRRCRWPSRACPSPRRLTRCRSRASSCGGR